MHLSPSHLSCPSLSSRSEYLAASADRSPSSAPATAKAAPSSWEGAPAEDDSLLGPGSILCSVL